jgi:hypothetical protein
MRRKFPASEGSHLVLFCFVDTSGYQTRPGEEAKHSTTKMGTRFPARKGSSDAERTEERTRVTTVGAIFWNGRFPIKEILVDGDRDGG